jgi:hypothetical protein
MWPALSEKTVEDKLNDHAALLCTEPKEVEEATLNALDIVRRSLFRNLEYRPSEDFTPTGGACLQVNRKNGGTLGIALADDLETPSFSAPFGEHKVKELSARIAGWRSVTFKRCWQMALGYESNKLEDGTRVKIIPILEPSKVRVITVGDGYVNNALQPLQKELLKEWKHSPQSTMLLDDLEAAVNLMSSKTPDNPLWVSVDYDAATDRMNRNLTREMIKMLNIDPVIKRVALYSFGENLAEYPHLSLPVLLKNGQLMGHPLSFPLLCWANLSALVETAIAYFRRKLIRFTWSRADTSPKGWRVSPRYLKLVTQRGGLTDDEIYRFYLPDNLRNMIDYALINGDDMLFRAPDLEFVVMFRQIAEHHYGLKPSAGKNYISRSFGMINSQYFQAQKGTNGRVMIRRGYLNLKLVKGTSLKGGDSKAIPTQIGKEFSEMVRHCPWAVSTLPETFNRWPEWFSPRFKPNWFLPVHLGGFGVNPKLSSGFRVTRHQRLVAARFVADPRLALFALKSTSPPPRGFANLVPQPKLVYGDYVAEQFETEEDHDGFLGRMLTYARIKSLGKSDFGSQEYLMRRMPLRSRLKPMSEETLAHYVSLGRPRFFSYLGPDFGSLGTVVYGDLEPYRYHFLNEKGH